MSHPFVADQLREISRSDEQESLSLGDVLECDRMKLIAISQEIKNLTQALSGQIGDEHQDKLTQEEKEII